MMDFAVPADHRVKLKEGEKKNKYLELARELKKSLYNWCARYSYQRIWYQDCRTLKKEDKWRPSKLQHCWDRLEYWEESWRLEETYCPSDSSKKPTADAGVKELSKE